MRIMIAGGGTAGHINPAIAIAQYIRKRQPSSEILFIGASGAMEERLVADAGFKLITFPMRGFLRSLAPKALLYNLGTVKRLKAANKAIDKILDEFKPGMIFATGGFASYPPVIRGFKRKIPTIIHESNVLPGRTNRLLAKYADRVLVGFEDAEKHFKDKKKLVYTGNPLREGMSFLKKDEAKKALGIYGDLVYSVWGSLGARDMNKITAEMFALEVKEKCQFHHIHSTGVSAASWMPEYIKGLGVDLAASKNIDMREYVYNAPVVLAAADLVLCRAGAMTMSEICAMGTPAIIIPSPNVAENHQHKNAKALSDRGAAIMLEESELTAEKLFNLVKDLLADTERRKAMSHAAHAIAVYDAHERIYCIITDIVYNGAKKI